MRSLRLVEPALTTRIEPTPSVRPGPAADLRVILAVLARPCAGAEASVGELLPDAAAPGNPRQPVERVHGEVEAIEVVQHDHVERRRRRPLLLVAAHVDVLVVRVPVREAVDEPRVAVV